jgi:RimJ/RimL family protein N-acetyltransferase
MSDIQFHPYNQRDGIPTFADSFIMGLFVRMVEEGTANRVFCSQKLFCQHDFLAMFKTRENYLWAITVDGEISGVFWLNHFEERSAQVHYCLFKNAWGRKKSIEIGRQIVRFCLQLKREPQGFVLDVITGVTPANNRLAIRFAEASGMTIAGEIPNLVWLHAEQRSIPAVISYATRESVGGQFDE